MYHINNKKLIPEEMTLIEYLANKAKFQLESNWKDHIVACPLTEGKIGSMGLLKDNMKEYVQRCSREISCCKFHDTDSVEVDAYLLVDTEDALCELDLWKVDYSEIYHIPSVDCMEDIPQI